MGTDEYKKFFERYHQFEKNNLPTPFDDKERYTTEYVFHRDIVPWYISFDETDDDYKYDVNPSLVESLGSFAHCGFYYSFTSGYRTYNPETDTWQKEVGHDHGHSFEEVVKALYNYPESFSISKDEEQYYSKQELEYLRRLQKYLLFIDVKDIEGNENDKKRYINEKQKKYEGAYFRDYSDKTIKDMLSGKLNFEIMVPYNADSYKDSEELKDFKALILDKEDNIKMFIEFTHREKKKYKDVKDQIEVKNVNDDDVVFAQYFKVLEKFDN